MNREAAERLYMTEDQIIDDIFSHMDPSDRRSWLAVEDKKTLISGHNSTGQAIRNRYLLWSPHNPIVDLTDPMSDRFPDQISQRIIEKIWERCKAEASKANV